VARSQFALAEPRKGGAAIRLHSLRWTVVPRAPLVAAADCALPPSVERRSSRKLRFTLRERHLSVPRGSRFFAPFQGWKNLNPTAGPNL
jgi:hypothetical protein